jgi:hypothetical protein
VRRSRPGSDVTLSTVNNQLEITYQLRTKRAGISIGRASHFFIDPLPAVMSTQHSPTNQTTADRSSRKKDRSHMPNPGPSRLWRKRENFEMRLACGKHIDLLEQEICWGRRYAAILPTDGPVAYLKSCPLPKERASSMRCIGDYPEAEAPQLQTVVKLNDQAYCRRRPSAESKWRAGWESHK